MKKPYYMAVFAGFMGLVAAVGSAAAGHHIKAQHSDVWLGVAVSELPFEQLRALEIDYGVAVDQVQNDSPADKAGLMMGDVIVTLDGQAVFSVSRLQWLVKNHAEGDKVQLDIRRDGEAQRLQAALASRSAGDFGHPGAHPPMKHHPHHGGMKKSYLGVTLQELTDDLREHFGAPADRGVLVSKVYDDSPAATAGLTVGDVIVKMDRKTIRHISDVHRVLDYFDPAEDVVVDVIRDKQREQLTVTLAGRPAMHPKGHERHPDWPQYFDPRRWHDELKRYRDDWRDYWERVYPPHYRHHDTYHYNG